MFRENINSLSVTGLLENIGILRNNLCEVNISEITSSLPIIVENLNRYMKDNEENSSVNVCCTQLGITSKDCLSRGYMTDWESYESIFGSEFTTESKLMARLIDSKMTKLENNINFIKRMLSNLNDISEVVKGTRSGLIWRDRVYTCINAYETIKDQHRHLKDSLQNARSMFPNVEKLFPVGSCFEVVNEESAKNTCSSFNIEIDQQDLPGKYGKYSRFNASTQGNDILPEEARHFPNAWH